MATVSRPHTKDRVFFCVVLVHVPPHERAKVVVFYDVLEGGHKVAPTLLARLRLHVLFVEQSQGVIIVQFREGLDECLVNVVVPPARGAREPSKTPV